MEKYDSMLTVDLIYKLRKENTTNSKNTVGTYRQGYLLLVCPTREARGYL
jgi:hypothetical protein